MIFREWTNCVEHIPSYSICIWMTTMVILFTLKMTGCWIIWRRWCTFAVFREKVISCFLLTTDGLWLILIVYYFFSDILETFLNATPNIEELHIGYSNRSALDPWTPSDYKSSIYGNGADCLKMIGLRCDRLTTLSLSAFSLFEGDFFETVSTIFIHRLN